jgi:polynucleotide 5'-kinase involved in rRNA processing
VAKESHFDLTEDQLYNCVGIVEAMKRSKGVAIVGGLNTGKTTLMKFVTEALKKGFDTVLRTSYVSP